MASWTRAHWLYLYLAIVMTVCFLLGNVAHSMELLSQNLGSDIDMSNGSINKGPVPNNAPPPEETTIGKQPPAGSAKAGSPDLYRLDFRRQDPFYQPLQIAPQTERFQLMNYFASGQSFYLDRDSFQAMPDGTLRYSVIGKNLYLTNGEDRPNQRSGNVVDCKRGMFTPQTSRELLDAQGNVVSRDTYQNAPPKTLSPSSPLYAILKNACAEHFKSADFSHWR